MAAIPDSAISIFHFEDDMNDVLGNASISNSGTALSTTQKKFGAKSLYFNGTTSSGSRLTITPSSSSIETIAFWFYRTADLTNSWFQTPMCLKQSGTAPNGAYFHLDDAQYDSYPVWRVASQTGGALASQTGGTAITTNTWHHVALTRDGTTFKYYLDGVLQATCVQTSPPTTNILYLGVLMGSSADAATYFQGYIDELIIATDILWTTNFTPPTDAYGASSANSFFFGMNF